VCSSDLDEVIILEKPDNFFAVSQAYENFYNLTDDDALGFMERWEKDKSIFLKAD
jgi:predicted phosphoribosyltransferase